MSGWVCGWDIGGAHIKWALRDPAGRWVEVRQLPCPLWQGIDRLSDALALATRDWPVAAGEVMHAATMTGELVDAFGNRAEGVVAIVDCCQAAFAGADWRWFGLDGRLHGCDVAHLDPLRFASANWLASANCAARHADGLFIDIGSTTTDIVALAGGAAQPRALTDGDRLSAGELVYRGIVRTPLMAVAGGVDWRGVSRPLMAEHFATSADVFRLTGDLEESADAWPAADGGDKTASGSARRVARLIGEGLEAASLDEWRVVAAQMAEAMSVTIVAAARQVLDQTTPPLSAVTQRVGLAPQGGSTGAAGSAGSGDSTGNDHPSVSILAQQVVCAGTGHWLAARVAARLGLPAIDFAALVGAAGVPGACEHAPALAVAELAAAQDTEHASPG